jgi:cytochrome P450
MDNNRMPYVMATLREALRLSTPAPLGFIHYTENDADLQDFAIPKVSFHTSQYLQPVSRNHDG